jgi:hypothetical protein
MAEERRRISGKTNCDKRDDDDFVVEGKEAKLEGGIRANR